MAGRRVRLFVSSTFLDFKAERDALQAEVFPAVRRTAAGLGIEFQVVDLRWGVTDAAGYRQTTMEVCLGEIERCKQAGLSPNFLFMLGDRAGWRPLPEAIPDQEFGVILDHASSVDRTLIEEWYLPDANAVPPERVLRARLAGMRAANRWHPIESSLRRIIDSAVAAAGLPADRSLALTGSATEREIARGVFDDKDPAENVIGVFRTIDGLPEDKPPSQYVDVDEAGGADQEQRRRLRDLKARLRRTVPRRRLRSYRATWLEGQVTTDHLRPLCADVHRLLERAIAASARRRPRVEPMKAEREAQRAFAKQRSEHFTGRRADADRLRTYLGSAAGEDHPLVLHGEPGTGKSALLAHVLTTRPPRNLVYRFVGASPASARGTTLLAGLCRESASMVGVTVDPTEELLELQRLLGRVMCMASADHPLVFVVDGVDQLADDDPARSLAWVPTEVPEYVRFVVSTLPGSGLDSLRRRLPDSSFHELGELSTQHGSDLVDKWLKAGRRRLTAAQRSAVLSGFRRTGRPLYLRLAFETARHWRSFDTPPALGKDIDSLVRELFGRLGDDASFGPELVARSLAYLRLSREGLTEVELLDLLSGDASVMRDQRRLSPASPVAIRLPDAVWSRLRQGLSDYLMDRESREAPLLGFFHGQIGRVVDQDYLPDPRRLAGHRHLAAYFSGISARGVDPLAERRVVELPFHQIRGRIWRTLGATLIDPEFVDAKASMRGVQSVVDDFQLALDSGVGTEPNTMRLGHAMDSIVIALRVCAHHVTADPDQLWPQLHGLLGGSRTVALKRFLERGAPTADRTWLRPITGSLAIDPRLRRTIPAHDGGVMAAALAPDGSRAASLGGRPARVRIWEPETGVQLADFAIGAGVGERTLALSGDGSELVVGLDDGAVEIRAADTGALLRRLESPSPVRVVVATDSGAVLSGHADGSLRRAGEGAERLDEVLPPGESGEEVEAMAASADGRRALVVVLSSGRGRFVTRLLLWDEDRGAAELDDPGHVDAVRSVALDARGTYALSGAASGDDTVRRWRVDSARGSSVFEHRGPIRAVAFITPTRVASVSGSPRDSSIRIWDTKTKAPVPPLVGHTRGINAMAASRRGDRLLTGAMDGSLKLWDPTRGADRAALRRHRGPVNGLAVSPDGRTALTIGGEGRVIWWDVRTGATGGTMRWEHDLDPIGMRVALSGDGRWGAVNFMNEPARVWERTGHIRHRLTGVPVTWDWVNAMAFQPGGRLLFTAGNNDLVHAWDLVTGQERWRAGDEETSAIAVQRDGSLVFAGSQSGITVYDAETGRRIYAEPLDEPVGALAVTPDGRRLVSSTDAITIWRVEQRGRGADASAVVTDPLHLDEERGARNMAISADGRWVAVAENDLRILEIDGGGLVARFAGDGDVVRCGFADGDRVVVCGEGSGRVHFLRIS